MVGKGVAGMPRHSVNRDGILGVVDGSAVTETGRDVD